MNCDEARELLLESDPEELRIESDTLLSSHLRECSSCRKLASSILNTQSDLAVTLSSQMPALEFEEAMTRAVVDMQTGSTRRLRILPFLLPVAAAAALFLLLLPLWSQGPEPPVEMLQVERVAEYPAVKAPPGKTALILDSGRQDMQIIWLF